MKNAYVQIQKELAKCKTIKEVNDTMFKAVALLDRGTIDLDQYNRLSVMASLESRDIFAEALK